MTTEKVRSLALAMPGAAEVEAWGHATFRVEGKIFVGLDEDARTANLKTSADEQAALVGSDPDAFELAPRVGRHGWTRVRVGKIDAEQMRELIVEAWRRTAPKKLVAEYDG
jgi:hypothetical protein